MQSALKALNDRYGHEHGTNADGPGEALRSRPGRDTPPALQPPDGGDLRTLDEEIHSLFAKAPSARAWRRRGHCVSQSPRCRAPCGGGDPEPGACRAAFSLQGGSRARLALVRRSRAREASGTPAGRAQRGRGPLLGQVLPGDCAGQDQEPVSRRDRLSGRAGPRSALAPCRRGRPGPVRARTLDPRARARRTRFARPSPPSRPRP